MKHSPVRRLVIVIGCVFLLTGFVVWAAIPPRPQRGPAPLQYSAQRHAGSANASAGGSHRTPGKSDATARIEKDEKLSKLTRDALLMHRIGAAWSAATLIGSEALKGSLMHEIFEEAIKICETMPWAAAALHDLGRDPEVRGLGDELSSRWMACPH